MPRWPDLKDVRRKRFEEGRDRSLVAPQKALARRYTVEGEIGRGGMAIVYRGRDLKHKRPVAVRSCVPRWRRWGRSGSCARSRSPLQAITAAGTEQLTSTGLVVGTPVYMSPGQCAGEAHLDGRSAVYALACALNEMLAGAPSWVLEAGRAIRAGHPTDPVPVRAREQS